MIDEYLLFNNDRGLGERIIHSEVLEGLDIQDMHNFYLFKTGMKMACYFNLFKRGKKK